MNQVVTGDKHRSLIILCLLIVSGGLCGVGVVCLCVSVSGVCLLTKPADFSKKSIFRASAHR